jgi:hypothetical protein
VGQHKIGFRGIFTLLFFSRNIYYVLLLDENYRDPTRRYKTITAFTFILFVSLFGFLFVMSGMLVLYLVKSALGIDIIDSFLLVCGDGFKDYLANVDERFLILWQKTSTLYLRF